MTLIVHACSSRKSRIWHTNDISGHICLKINKSSETIWLLLLSLPSHELTLRTVGDRLIARGHSVTQESWIQINLRSKPNHNNVIVISIIVKKQVRYAQTDSHYDLQTNVSVLTLRWWKKSHITKVVKLVVSRESTYSKLCWRIDDSGYPCHRYVNRKGEFDIENQEINLVSDFS